MQKKLIVFVVLALVGGFMAGYFFATSQKTAYSEGENSTSNHPFLAKRLYVDNRNDFLLNFQPLRKALNKYITENKDVKIEYYFEYLPSGMSIGINEQNQVPAGSLIKIPAVMAVYKKIEQGKLRELDTITLQESHKDKEYGDFWKKPTGTKVTIEEAVREVLIHSDNTAYKMLLTVLSPAEFKEALEITDISIVNFGSEIKPYVSPKSNASALKALFLSVFLNQESSNKILSLMSQSTFNDGLKKNIPKEVKVAHKIGFASFLDKPSTSDCGIFYVPDRSYVLCIMVHGDRTTALEHIAKLSEMTYSYVAKDY